MKSLPKRYYTNTDINGLETYVHLLLYLLLFLVVVFVTIVVLRVLSLRRTNAVEEGQKPNSQLYKFSAAMILK
jgi:hypothetical protein